MHIVVCIKQIIDPEVPFHLFRIDPVTKTQIRGSHPLVISLYDEVAVEVAIQAKEKFGGRVTVITIGTKEAVQALHQALAMGADAAVLLSDPAFEGVDSFGKARILAAALRKIGSFDLVLCGRQAGDVEMGLVGPFLAEELGIPCATLVSNVVSGNGKIRLKRPTETGYEVLEAPLPCLATITNDETNVPRYASVKGIRAAMRVPIPTWSAADLGLDLARSQEERRIEIDEMWIPQREIRCELISGESAEERARNLALRLRELGLI
ncbi:MAG: electron transfer flavoprotein subunit beta/FixA family protein [Anaerolineae bacterium]|nr:electron transfer flavoprotein subunit beta/FixA family protein [Anaerolineae bacterium]MCX8066945.1 electron transfer flavoprotein subunit beta/FixA family protein [Anaerolineae bacterium]MDW7991511.1 electron transfer flavoprotein subunit beta/FixA family protein [Anaerolineae bacterium]